MTGEAVFDFVLISVAAAMMASNRIRFDVVALLVVLALMLSGLCRAYQRYVDADRDDPEDLYATGNPPKPRK